MKRERDCTVLIGTYFGNSMVTNLIASLMANVKNPKILVYKNDEGWLNANNRLIEIINSDVLLLNDDTLAVSDLVSEMQSLAYSDPQIGIVGGKALAPDGEMVVNYGIYIAPDGNTAHRFYGKNRLDITSVEDQRAIEGSCMYIKREVIDKIGIFDTRYGAGYRAEVSYCFAAIEAGYKVVSCPTAEYIHFQHVTHGKLGISNDTYDTFMEQWGRKLKLGEI